MPNALHSPSDDKLKPWARAIGTSPMPLALHFAKLFPPLPERGSEPKRRGGDELGDGTLTPENMTQTCHQPSLLVPRDPPNWRAK